MGLYGDLTTTRLGRAQFSLLFTDLTDSPANMEGTDSEGVPEIEQKAK
jgi:hypothetical protein